ncbi:MAG: helix-turn-helix domain-containing protein [Clostridiales bacterium]|nr:helix-turn-helix domain-containing protein [Clostridiales bacterium]
MILADKIIQLRKKNGWSQEELAAQLNVSRQAVSKWESAQAAPDLNKILAMSQLFGVTTDYLLKDDLEAEEFTGDGGAPALRRVTLAEAGEFLSWRDKASGLIAGALLLCVLGVIALLAIGVSAGALGLSEDAAGGLGVGALLVFVAAAVLLFVYCGHRNGPYEFLEKEDFDTEYGVDGLAQKKRQDGQKAWSLQTGAGLAMCVLSPIPLVMSAFLAHTDTARMLLTCLTLLLAGGGAALIVLSGVRRAAVDKLLRQGDYSPEAKRVGSVTGPVSVIYWLLVTAAFLAWSFLGNGWNISWVIWPIAGVLYAAVRVVCTMLADKKNA